MEHFNLDEAIKAWKKKLGQHQGLEPGYIEELECNLRDRIDDYLNNNYSEKQAFNYAREKSLDSPEVLADEYFKARTNRSKTPPWKQGTTLFSVTPIYFKIAIRYLFKRKVYSALSIFGLAISIAASFLIWLYVQDQQSYDDHIENADRIYRVNTDININGKRDVYCNAARPVAHLLKAEFPEVEEVVRLKGIGGLETHTSTLKVNEKRIETTKIFLADSSIFKVFKFGLIKGNADKALVQPKTIVISESLAIKLFNNTEVLGETIQLSGDSQNPLKITGVMRDNTNNSHLPVEALVSWSTFPHPGDFTQWYGAHVYTYILLDNHNDIKGLRNKIPRFYDRYMKDFFENTIGGSSANIIFQPLTSIYLDPEYTWEPYPHGSRFNVNILSLVILFLLVIACINYVNLATARSAERAGEVGIRKTMGSPKRLLIIQFITESVILALFSGIIAILLSMILIPYFNNLSGMRLEMASIFNYQGLLYILMLSLTIGIIAGIYPAFYLSSFKPVKILNGNFTTGTSGERLRKILVISQYAISSILIAGILIVAEQTSFIKNKDIGFSKENVLSVNIPNDATVTNHQGAFMEALRNKSYVNGVTNLDYALSEAANQWLPELEYPDGSTELTKFEVIDTDYEFVKTIGAKIVQGRDFDRRLGNSEETSFLINEAAVIKYGWQNCATDMKFAYDTDDNGNIIYWYVIGVVSDFNIGASYQTINPLMIRFDNSHTGRNTYIKIEGKDILSSMKDIKSVWKDFFPEHSFDYRFLDEELATIYIKEERFLSLLAGLSFVIIFITSIGIVGLISFTAEIKRKEIAIRKVNGSPMKAIVFLLSKKFISLLIVANLISMPVGYYLVQQWLYNFEQRIELTVWPFVWSLVICGVFTAIALIYHTTRAALENPVNSLRSE